MNRISNDFVIIEYKHFAFKDIAEGYMNFFNEEPEFFKGLLNGKKIITEEELSIFSPKEDKDIIKQVICSSIVKSNSNKTFNFLSSMKFMDESLHQSVNLIYYNREVPYRFKVDLALNYFNNTKDFSYLRKILYDNGLDKEDLDKLFYHTIVNNFEKLIMKRVPALLNELKNSSIAFDRFLYNNSKGISNLIFSYSNNLINNVAIQKTDYSLIPKINEEELDILMKGFLSYIDPSNIILKEYERYMQEGRIKKQKIELEKENQSAFYYNYKDDDYGIYLSTYGNLVDAISLSHEFGHMYFELLNINNKYDFDSPFILNEYPSVFFETKFLEYLKIIGYSDNEIEQAYNFRQQDNAMKMTYIFLLLSILNNNIKEDFEGDYTSENIDINQFQQIFSVFDNLPFYATNLGLKFDDINLYESVDLIKYSFFVFFLDRKLIKSTFSYFIGSSLANYASSNLDNKTILKILKDIQFTDDPVEIIEKNGIDVKSMNFKFKNKKLDRKIKNELIDNN